MACGEYTDNHSKLEELILLVGFVMILHAQVLQGYTVPSDVAAVNSLYASLGLPPLPNWQITGGDPCGGGWQGISCKSSVISSIILNGANLGGELGGNLSMFSAIEAIDLSNNHIGSNIPSSLPSTMQHFFLSDNNFTGGIPSSLALLTNLTDMSLNQNLLTGEIPDGLGALSALINLDLSTNNLSGHLPSSMADLTSLTTLRVQDNQLSGTLGVLQDLPLRDLNVENNLFSGSVPQKLMAIPNFRKEGNLFNRSIVAAPPSVSPSALTPSSPLLAPVQPPGNHTVEQPFGPSRSGRKKKFTTGRIVLISFSGALLFIILALGLILFLSKFWRGWKKFCKSFKRYDGALKHDKGRPGYAKHVIESGNGAGKEFGTSRRAPASKPNDQVLNVHRTENEELQIDMGSPDNIWMLPSPPPPPPPFFPSSPPPPPQNRLDRAATAPISSDEVHADRLSIVNHPGTSVNFFTIASLQQYTSSFDQENLIGGGMLGSVYRAKVPDGTLLALKKLDKKVCSLQRDDEFIELVNAIDKIRHSNVVELMGYCAEHGQRLLIYEYCCNGTLHDALHVVDEYEKQLPWKTRIQIALGAARALWYLHETCEPPIVHRNFKSANILLDEELTVRVSDCGLAPLITSGIVSQLSGHLESTYGYGAPEFEDGTYTFKSDVYSFGIVMLELLTGRQSYDKEQSQGEQFLVRWAVPKLHDIDALSEMVDHSLHGKFYAKSLSRFADIIARCVQVEPEFRPLMSEVVQDLADLIRKEPP